MNGFINYYKPSGISSAYAINRIKKLFKGCKIGHMGTLDPLAEGVLPLAVGKSTRLFDFLLDKEKIYIAEFTFGYETDTLDRGGKIIKSEGLIPTKEEILKVLPTLVGKVDQIPPLYSAKNVGGERSYHIARRGGTVELKPKTVEIDSIVLDGGENGVYTFTITCKGGTYIRSICRDLAYALNTFATMTKLKRIKSGAFTLENAVTEQDLIELKDLKSLLIKPDKMVDFKSIHLDEYSSSELASGRPFKIDEKDGVYKVYDNLSSFIGIGIVNENALKIKAYLKDD
ncbi:MAG: tRNA pseudouridine(55) synthase TruB [Clostridiales bacterium]|nr:tRNA pseudouridine(55) synthase TruB [Clostridiales bacterium]